MPLSSLSLPVITSFEALCLDSNQPIFYAGMGVAIIAATVLVFVLYDCFVRKHQKKLVKSAHKNAALVNSLFPENVRDRMMNRDSQDRKAASKKGRRRSRKRPFMAETSPSSTVSTFDADRSSPFSKEILSSKPIADFFPHTTVLFADIVGFTAWSSVRDPTQVFTLLECLYIRFDVIAKKRTKCSKWKPLETVT
jgi:hypothetical protein